MTPVLGTGRNAESSGGGSSPVPGSAEEGSCADAAPGRELVLDIGGKRTRPPGPRKARTLPVTIPPGRPRFGAGPARGGAS